MKENKCSLKEEPFYQCCCNCVHHKPVHFHCITEPKPTAEQRGDHKGCDCGVQKSWSCDFEGRVHDNWPEHSIGCEGYYTHEMSKKEKELPPEYFTITVSSCCLCPYRLCDVCGANEDKIVFLEKEVMNHIYNKCDHNMWKCIDSRCPYMKERK
jgi:hypothetical protein